ncbi:hypothetical protein EDB19DRAFT_1617727, partial [Suillus lakei]
KFTIHSKEVACQEGIDHHQTSHQLKATVVHPKVTVFPISRIPLQLVRIHQEAAINVNRRQEVLMRAGDENSFEIGCRAHSPSIGNTAIIERLLSLFIGTGAACLVVPSDYKTLDDYPCV